MATQFHNFDLELYDYKELPSGEVSYAVRVSHTPREQVQAQPDVVRVPQGFAAVIAAITQRWQHRDANALAGSCTQLGQWLFPPGSAALGFLRDSHSALGTDEALFLRLKCASAELACIPWEYASVDLGQPNDGQFQASRMLAVDPKVCIIRYDGIEAPVERANGRARTSRILYVSAQPKDSLDLGLDGDKREIASQLEQCKAAPSFDALDHATRFLLQARLKGARVDVFHFSGHGGVASNGGGVLEFESDDGTLDEVAAGELAMYLKGIGVSVAVLAACATAEIERKFPWSSVARALVEIGIPAVVGMQFRVENKSALVFLRMFYRTLASGASIGDAVVEGRKAMFAHEEFGCDFGVPVLYLRNSDNANTVVFPADIAESRAQTTAVESNVQAADGYKRLHDALHRAKFDAYNFMLDLEAAFPPRDDRGRNQLASCRRTLADCGRDMQVVAREGHCDPELVQPLVDAFSDGLAQLDKAIRDWDKEAFDASMLTFEPMFRFEMTRLDGSIVDRVQALPKGEGLAALLSEDEQRVANLNQLFDRMRALVGTHHAGQLLQERLDQVQGSNGVDVRRLGMIWTEVQKRLGSMSPALDESLAGQLSERTQTLRSALDQTDAGRVSSSYWDFRYVVDQSFYRIDDDLRKLCSKVNEDLRASIAA